MRTIRSLAVALAVAAAMLAPASAARAGGGDFTFYGAGWGHAVGMGQYGAYGLANDGWSTNRIVTHFYRGTKVAATTVPGAVRVGLLQGSRSIGIKAVDAGVRLNLNSGSGPAVATVPVGQSWTVRLRYGVYWVQKSDGTYVGNHGFGTSDSKLVASYRPTGSAYLPSEGHTYGWGTLEFNIYRPCDDCIQTMRALNVLGMQAYLYGIAEVPSSWPTAALEAQAIAARTYALARIAAYGQNRPTCNCALYDSTYDQVFVGSDKERGVDGDRWVDAVGNTLDKIAMAGTAAAGGYYHSSSGGYTENNEVTLGGAPASYLRGVCDPGDYTTSNPNRFWTVSFTAAYIADRIALYTGVDVGTVTGISISDRGVSGRVISANVTGTAGSTTVSGSTLKSALNLKDTRVWVNSDRIVTGEIRTRYDQLMCAPGLQLSASFEVDGGRYQRFDDGRIYANYDRGVAYWVHDGVLEKYLDLGAHDSFLGLPETNVLYDDSANGYWTTFEGGRIYWSARTGGHELHGPVYERYKAEGAHDSGLGLPTSDVVKSGGTESAEFEHGTITCNLSNDTCTVNGAGARRSSAVPVPGPAATPSVSPTPSPSASPSVSPSATSSPG